MGCIFFSGDFMLIYGSSMGCLWDFYGIFMFMGCFYFFQRSIISFFRRCEIPNPYTPEN